MNNLPEIKNEPTVQSSGDVEGFADRYRATPRVRADDGDDRPKARFRYLPALLAILAVLVAGWHWLAAHQLEERLSRHFETSVRENLPDVSLHVAVNPLTNLVDIQFTRTVSRKEAGFDLLADLIIEFARQELEPRMERELSAAARRDNDIYAMLVPYQVSMSIDKVRAPPPSPPSRMVQEIQRQLKLRGYDPGPADGQLGGRTRNAILKFQRDHGLTEDGQANGELLEKLRQR